MMKEHTRRKASRAKLAKMGYKSGGHMHADEAEDTALIKKMVKPSARKHLKDGGCADGGVASPRADRLARGGKTKHHKNKGKGHTTVNVLVGGGHKPEPVPVPVPMGGPPPGGMPMPPPGAGPGGPPPGMGAGPPPPGGPIGLKKGGRTKGPKIDSQRDSKGGMPAGHFAKGGMAKGKFPVPMRDGAGGGLGRLQKAKDYGAKT